MNKSVEVIECREVFNQGPFRINEARLRFERFNGQMSDEIKRLNLDRGDSAAALVHDTDTDEIVLAEQFRFPSYEKGPGWLLELPAGMVEKGEDPQQAILREVEEEIGFVAKSVTHITTVYLSPGGTSERIHIYYAPCNAAQKTSDGGGLESEGEDIRIVNMTAQEAIRKMNTGEIVDAKTVIAIQWLHLKQLAKIVSDAVQDDETQRQGGNAER